MDIPVDHFEPLDEYQNMLQDEYFTAATRKKILAMAVCRYKKVYGTTPPVADWMINWAMADTIDRGRWKQDISVHNLRIYAAERLFERMATMDYDLNLNWFDVQEQKRNESIATPCGGHFVDRLKVRSVNIL